MNNEVTRLNMHYSQYKKHYADCKTEPGSYNERNRTIVVIIPEGRLKNSGVRGKHFHGYELYFFDEKNKECYSCYRATCRENAEKQHLKECKKNGWIPVFENDEIKCGHIYL